MKRDMWLGVTGAWVVLMVASCGRMAGTDTVDPPATLSGTVRSQSYTVGTAIETLTLPAAAGGGPSLTYSLEPDVPGLTFDPAGRTLSGTPSRAGHYQMTYAVADAGEDAAGEAATLPFMISVTLPLPGTWHFQLPVVATAQIEETTLTVTIGDRTSALGATAPYDSITLVAVTGTLVFGDNALAFVLGREPDAIDVALTTGLTALQAEQARAAVRELARVADNQPVVIKADGTTMTVEGAGMTTLFRFVGVEATGQLTACRDGPCAPEEPAPEEPAPEEPAPEEPAPEDVAPEDVAPRFTGSVGDRTYTVGEAIDPLTLPEASGGNGARTYSLDPALPDGLTFEAVSRTVTGTPTVAGSVHMTYTAADSDDNTGASDTDTLRFTITVEDLPVEEPPGDEPQTPEPPETPSVPSYHGTWYLDFDLDEPAILKIDDGTFDLGVGDGESALQSDGLLSGVNKIAANGTFTVQSTATSGVTIQLTVETATVSPKSLLNDGIATVLKSEASNTVTLQVSGDRMTLTGNVVTNLGNRLGFSDTSLTACRDAACTS